MAVEKEVDRMLKLLREKIRDQGYTQLKVQEALGWGRTYISQLFRKQKSLRFDQILQILEVIEIDAVSFFSEFYNLSNGEIIGRSVYGIPSGIAAVGTPEGNTVPPYRRISAIVRLLVDKGLIEEEEYEQALREPATG